MAIKKHRTVNSFSQSLFLLSQEERQTVSYFLKNVPSSLPNRPISGKILFAARFARQIQTKDYMFCQPATMPPVKYSALTGEYIFHFIVKNSTLSPEIGHFPCIKRIISMG